LRDAPLVLAAELWTAGQRRAAAIHEISYRACFKPQLPAYFIERYTTSGEVVYDPFSGRGTTAIEAALQGRRVLANDINPLSALLAAPRLAVPSEEAIEARLAEIPRLARWRGTLDLSMFYERRTLLEIVALRHWLLSRRKVGIADAVDDWIGMVATNRLTGHSAGFFSVYSFQPNQAVTAERQHRINAQRHQVPSYRDTHTLILKKSRALLKDLPAESLHRLRAAAAHARFLTGDARRTPQIPSDSVALTVTSPPFLDVVDYAGDNWLRGWFNGLPVASLARRITTPRGVPQWSAVMGAVLVELFRITRPGGVVAFEVGEVQKGALRLDEIVLPLGAAAGFGTEAVLINTQRFTKTAHIWGVANNAAGTNTNRIVVFRKPA
jgi:hypothetical protein